ncbi:MAG: hypothetical protein JWO06_463 [Bacteroidota bacterium]|nr:hypothetical protein [Bacteroidota bacterium]
MRKIVLFLFLFSAGNLLAQYPLKLHPFSTQSEEGFSPCRDTFSILKRHLYYDIGIILPSWLPVVDRNYVATIEGKVAYNLVDGTDGPAVYHEDIPYYHYSHDLNFDLIPDKTEDNRFTNLMPYLVYKKENSSDTVMHNTFHCEWESGLAMSNKAGPLWMDNDVGRSGGFSTAGHEMGDMIWNWPAPGDWAHVEGHYVWDRGHPPSNAEIHPLRFMAFKRQLPEQIIIGDSSVKFATRIDIFASGDDGALMNNRYNAPRFVKRVNMSSKDYEFTATIDLPRPSPKSRLKYTVTKQKGDNFTVPETIELNDDSATAHILIPWKTKNANDLEIYARTIDVFWDEGSGVSTSLPIDIYKVKLTNIHFRHIDEILTKAEIRLFASVGNQWIFVNDFFPKKGKILTKGLGKTYKHRWTLNNEFTVCVPRGKSFRVDMNGWEVDGVDMLTGKLLDPGSPCNRKTKALFKRSSFNFTMFLRGCLDDDFGEISKLHSYDRLGKIDRFTNSPQSGMNDDPCPGSQYPLKDRYFLRYTIEKVN